MIERYELTVYGKRCVVELRGINLQRSSTTRWVVQVDGRTEFVSQEHSAAVRYISDLPDCLLR
jgi:hypothetical protein